MVSNIQQGSESGRPRVLVIDDDRKLCRLIRDYLEPLGYAVQTAHTGPDGLASAISEPWHAVILDVMLPGMDGFEVLKSIRRQNDVPVLMLTARGEEADRIVGLEIGADDYLPKTFSTRELLARLRAVTRRSQIATRQAGSGDEIEAGDIFLRLSSRTATQNGQPLDLTAFEFDLLHCIVRSAGLVLNRDQILDELAGRA